MDANFQQEADLRSCYGVVAASLTAEAEVSAETEAVEGSDRSAATNAATEPKPKTAKAGLPLKITWVCAKFYALCWFCCDKGYI